MSFCEFSLQSVPPPFSTTNLVLFCTAKLNLIILISNAVISCGQSIDLQVVDWMIYHLIKMLLLLDAVKAIDPQHIIAQNDALFIVLICLSLSFIS